MAKIGEWGDFRRYLYREGLALKKGVKGDVTHLLLDGGRLSVPDDRNEEFLVRYAQTMTTGEWTYVVEQKTLPVFYMMCEFDIKLTGENAIFDDEHKRALVRIVQSRVMSVAYPGRDVSVAVCTAPPKSVTLHFPSNAPGTQHGIHLMWRVPVDIQTAWLLRAWMLREIESGMAGAIVLPGGWAEAFDPSIFESNGIRMIGARKAIVCPKCKGMSYRRRKSGVGGTVAAGCLPSSSSASSSSAKKKPYSSMSENADPDSSWGDVCSECNNIGHIDMGRPYVLAYVADGLGNKRGEEEEEEKGEGEGDRHHHQQRNMLIDDPLNVVRLTTIRAIEPDEGGVGPRRVAEPWPISFPSESVKVQIAQFTKSDRSDFKRSKVVTTTTTTTTSAKKKSDGDDVDAQQKRRDSLTIIPPSSPIFDAIAKYILAEFPGYPVTTHVKRSASGGVYIINTSCLFCANKGSEHTGSKVFFCIKGAKCVQKCFSPLPEIRPVGKVACRDFVSREHLVPKDVLEAIYSAGALRVILKDEQRQRIAAAALQPRMVSSAAAVIMPLDMAVDDKVASDDAVTTSFSFVHNQQQQHSVSDAGCVIDGNWQQQQQQPATTTTTKKPAIIHTRPGHIASPDLGMTTMTGSSECCRQQSSASNVHDFTISRKCDYKVASSRITPRFTSADFLKAASNSKFKII